MFAVSGTVRVHCEYSVRGYLELLASMPNAAKVFYLEAIAAGPEAVTRRSRRPPQVRAQHRVAFLTVRMPVHAAAKRRRVTR